MKKTSFVLCSVILLSAIFISSAFAETINLPAPQTQGGMPLMEALNNRKSGRSYGPKKLELQTLSNLVWSAFGINRPDESKRTAPTARNTQEIDIYAVLEEGIYLYNPKNNTLVPVVKGDFRDKAGRQSFVKDAPVNLVFVADKSKLGNMSQSDIVFNTAINTGYISQNVYLFCASAGLSTVSIGLLDRDELSKVMKLRKDQIIIIAQCVGYPK